MKRIIAIITAAIMISGIVSVTSAHADRKTIEGFVLGTGVAILGAAIIQEINKDRVTTSKEVSYRHVEPRRYDPPRRIEPRRHNSPKHIEHKRYKKVHRHKKYARRDRGHWERERVWVGPLYERKWNPGHYNRKGEWISGRYERFMVQEGYWSQKKVWVRH